MKTTQSSGVDTQCRAWPRYCRKVCWTKMVQNGQNDHFGQNDLIPKLDFGIRKTTMDQNGPFWSILA